MHLCQAMPSTQPVEIDKFGGQTDQRHYIDKTELLSSPLTPFRREWTNNTTNSTIFSVEQLKLLLTRGKNEEKYNSTTSNSNVTSAKLGPKYKLIKHYSDQ